MYYWTNELAHLGWVALVNGVIYVLSSCEKYWMSKDVLMPERFLAFWLYSCKVFT